MVHLVGFLLYKYITMHGPVNVKFDKSSKTFMNFVATQQHTHWMKY